MKFFKKMKDGGPDSHVTGYFLIESKSLFSIVLLKFEDGTREAFHSHAFNALTLWLKGIVIEHVRDNDATARYRSSRIFTPFRFKYTPRGLMHKIQSLGTSWALSIRGPWSKTWNEFLPDSGKYVTLTHGRKIVVNG